MLSGATGLIYEVLWARMLGLVFGATTLAISAVLCAFMAGLALGSAIAGRVAGRLSRPVFAYGLIEIVIGLYALCVPSMFRIIDWAYAGIWQRWHPGFYTFALSRFALAALILIVPTALMGATLPVLAAALEQSNSRISINKFYAGNLAGAIVGTIAAGFFLLPSWGVTATIWLAAATNLLIGSVALSLDRHRHSPGRRVEIQERFASNPRAGPIDGATFWLWCAFVSGFVTIGMQLVWSRLLAMIIGSSTYAFSIVLALFLAGLTLGAYAVSRKKTQHVSSLRRTIFWIEVATVGSLFVSMPIINATPELLIQVGFRLGINRWSTLLAMQIGAAAMVIVIPAILMGMVLPLVLLRGQPVESDTENQKHELLSQAAVRFIGLSYALNTIGAIAGSLITAFVLIPGIGSRLTIFALASACLIVAGIAYEPRLEGSDRAVRRSFAAGVAAIVIIALFAVWPRLRLDRLSIGAYDSFVRVLAKSRGGVPDKPTAGDHQLLMFEEGRTSTVSVRRDWNITSLAINGRTNGSDSDDMPTQIMVGQLGVLAAPRLSNALVVGFATGVTVGSILQSPIESVVCVEIEPAAVAASHYFDHVNLHPLDDQRASVTIDDARTYLKVNPAAYDLIVSEPSHPWVPGVANLFTREFFALGRSRLRDSGVFVQWLQTYQLSTESLRSVLATFHDVFPHVLIFRVQGPAKGKDLILLGSDSALDFNRIKKPSVDQRSEREIGRAGLKSVGDLQSKWFVCDENQLGPALLGARINSDDNMLVETRAPREAFRPTLEENAAWIESLKLKR